MEKSKTFFDLQNRLFEEIRKHSSSQHLFVDVISDVLETSRDSAYRRIRGEQLLNIKEIHIL